MGLRQTGVCQVGCREIRAREVGAAKVGAVQNGVVVLRDMRSRQETRVPRAAALDAVRSILA